MVQTNCHFRDKHTVGGIVFYKHAFLVHIVPQECVVSLKKVSYIIIKEADYHDYGHRNLS